MPVDTQAQIVEEHGTKSGVDDLEDVEAALPKSHDGPAGGARREEAGTSRRPEQVPAGPRPNSPARSSSLTNTQSTGTSVGKVYRRGKRHSRRTRTRSSSRATSESIGGSAPVDPLPGGPTPIGPTPVIPVLGGLKRATTARRVNSGLQWQGERGPSLVTVAWRFLYGFFSAKKSEKDEDAGDVALDPDNPVPWVVDHHIHNLVEEIVPEATKDLRWWYLRSRGGDRYERHEEEQRERKRRKNLMSGESERTYRVSFAEMQRMHLRKLQISLVRHAVTMYSTKKESGRWEKELAAYIQAMKDYDYMVECSKRPDDSFLATGEHDIDHYVTKMVIKKIISDENQLDSMKKVRPLGPWKDDSRPIGGTRTSTIKELSLKDFRDRLLLATVGAALLLGPMWLMVLHKTLYTGLITTTVCVAVFGLVVVLRLDKPMDVLSATAAYAAVLVVFVGLTT